MFLPGTVLLGKFLTLKLLHLIFAHYFFKNSQTRSPMNDLLQTFLIPSKRTFSPGPLSPFKPRKWAKKVIPPFHGRFKAPGVRRERGEVKGKKTSPEMAQRLVQK